MSGVTSIGTSAFEDCTSLSGTVTIPGTVTSIGNRAFYGCTNLTGVTIQSGVTGIGDEAFYNCKKLNTHVAIPQGVTSIGEFAFANCEKLPSVYLPPSLTNLGYYAFYGCNLSSVNIPPGINYIGPYAFANNSSLSNVTIPATTGIMSNAFANCSISSVTITVGPLGTPGNGIIGSDAGGAFRSYSNWTLTMGNGVSSIEAYVFQDCSGLRSVSIPSSVTSIGEGAFVGCASLNTVIFGSGSNIARNNWGSDAFPRDKNDLWDIYSTGTKQGTYKLNSGTWVQQ
jgi:hypothetical protein